VTTDTLTTYTLPSANNMHLSPQRSLGKQRVLKTISGLALTLLALAECDTEVLYVFLSVSLRYYFGLHSILKLIICSVGSLLGREGDHFHLVTRFRLQLVLSLYVQ
jgi:hypothetical protein